MVYGRTQVLEVVGLLSGISQYIVDGIQSSDCIPISLAKPDQVQCRVRVYLSHECNLAIPFHCVPLVDTDGINPERATAIRVTHAPKNSLSACGNVESTAVQAYSSSHIRIAPYVRNRLVLGSRRLIEEAMHYLA
jgi:hypothetical protein